MKTMLIASAARLAWTCFLVLVLAALLWTTDASSQQTAVCSGTPGSGERIECTEDSTSTGAIDIDADGVDIDTSEDDAHGIGAEHSGTGDIEIDVTGSSTIDTTGAGARGVAAEHDGTGRIEIRVRDAAIATTGDYKLHGGDLHYAHGLLARHHGTATGDIVVDVRDSTIETEGASADAIAVEYSISNPADETAVADLDIDVRDSTIETTGRGADGIAVSYIGGSGDIDLDVVGTDIDTWDNYTAGIRAEHRYGAGDIDIDLENVDITTRGTSSDGIYVENDSNSGAGSIVIAVQGGSISTHGASANGIEMDVGISRFSSGEATTDIDVRDLDITTKGSNSDGISAFNAFTGDIAIDAHGGSIRTEGAYSEGIDGFSSGFGSVTIVTGDGHGITTTGESSSGILGVVSGPDAALSITVGGTVDASGANAHGVEVGTLYNGKAWQVATVDEEGYRKQTVTVNGSVEGGTGDAAGVFLTGGGRVYIGPEGTVGARSGIAIHATGDSIPRNADDPVLKPDLYVDMQLDGRSVADVIGDDRIVNDGGETTIVVNDVVLHDGATGATGNWAPNGARDISLKASNQIVGRDFALADFINGPFGPRAAVYEAMPTLLTRLDRPTGADSGLLPFLNAPGGLSMGGATGSYGAERATVGAGYDFDRFAAEAGVSIALDDEFTGLLSLRWVSGSVDVSAPTGGGTIEAAGRGLSAGLAWQGEDGVYAIGRLSATWYELDSTSDRRGNLETDADAVARSLGVEAGRHLAVSEDTRLTPRVWLDRSDVSISRFTDKVGTRVSFPDFDQLTGGAGGIVETDLDWGGGEEPLSLRASLGVERMLSGGEITVLASGEELKSQGAANRVLLGLGGSKSWGRTSLDLEFQTLGLGSDDREYGGRLGLRIVF